MYTFSRGKNRRPFGGLNNRAGGRGTVSPEYGKRFVHNSPAKNRIKTWEVSELERVVDQFSQDRSVTKDEVYTPKHSFNDFEISEQLKHNIKAKHYGTPTPIQDKAIPTIISKQDVIGIANTGTGKTAAFLIPLIERVDRDRARKVLILAPTRELATQIYDEFRAFSQGMQIFTAILIGGANIERQKRELRNRPNFVIATPGRLRDLLKQNAIKLHEFNTVVLDETDRMVDIGFINDIKYFISLMSKDRQSLFFSATVSPKVEEIIASFVKNPVTISVKRRETTLNVEQKIIRVNNRQKLETLDKLLKGEDYKKVLVFGSTKWKVQKLSEDLSKRGHKAAAIHGNKSQSQRQTVLRMFKQDAIRILLATDVASRGLDIKDVTHVINFDMPESYEAYVHRIGRTGRADKKGIALTFVDQ